MIGGGDVFPFIAGVSTIMHDGDDRMGRSQFRAVRVLCLLGTSFSCGRRAEDCGRSPDRATSVRYCGVSHSGPLAFIIGPLRPHGRRRAAATCHGASREPQRPRRRAGRPRRKRVLNPANQPGPANRLPRAKKKEGAPRRQEEKPADVQRPEQPPKEADPKQLEVVLDGDGLVPAFNFQGQPWPAVIQWYAKLASCSSDWQELPNGYINIANQRPAGLEEVRNQLNRFLLARGFVLIQRDRAVSVYKMENLDPSLVDQVNELELYSRKKFDVVKCAYALPKGMDATKAKDDLKQVLNPKAKIMPLVLTKQMLIIDAVANLQTVSQLLNEERLKEDDKSPIREFVLKYVRAEAVIDILYIELGLDPKTKPSQMELQLQQQKMQIMQQMAKHGTDMSSMLKKDGPPVFLSYNRQKNSVIANAPDEQMEMIDKLIKILDVPIGGVEAAPVTTSKEVDRTIKTATFKLKTLNPTSLQTTLEEIGGLDPFTVLKADATGRALFVQGITADHERIKSLIEQLDGEERVIKMIQLRRYPADLAAVSIQELMGVQKKDSNEDSQAAYYRALANMYSTRGSSTSKDDSHDGFYVSADSVNNRLLIRANKLELEMITNLLRELGEVPAERKNGVATRVVEPPGEDILDRIRKAWGQTEENPLLIDGAPKSTATSNEKTEESEDNKQKAQSTTPAKDRGVQLETPVNTAAVFARFASPPGESDESASAGSAATKDAAASTPEKANSAAAPAAESAAKTAAAPNSPPPRDFPAVGKRPAIAK